MKWNFDFPFSSISRKKKQNRDNIPKNKSLRDGFIFTAVETQSSLTLWCGHMESEFDYPHYLYIWSINYIN